MFEARFQTFEDRDRARGERRPARGAARGTETPRSRRLHRAARRPPSERIRAAVRGAARLAHRLHRLGRRRDRARRPRRASSSTGAICCRCATRSTPRCSRSSIWSTTRPTSGWRPTCQPARASAIDPWLHTADGAERLAKAARAAGATLVPAEPIRSTRSGPTAPPRRSGRVTVHDLKFAGEAGGRQARARAGRDRQAQGRRADRLRSAQRRLDLQHPRLRTSSHTPLPLSFASVPREGRASLYIDGRKLSNEVRDYLETLADVREPACVRRRPEGARRREGGGAARFRDRRRRARAH